MFLSNDDDIDELFRRAANNYPLNTDSADWNVVVKKLPSTQLPESDNFTGNNRNRRGLLLVLLLIPMIWLCNKYSADDLKQDETFSKVSKQKQRPSTSDGDKVPIGVSRSKVINAAEETLKTSQVQTIKKNKRSNKFEPALQNKRPLTSPERRNITLTWEKAEKQKRSLLAAKVTSQIANLGKEKEAEAVNKEDKTKNFKTDSMGQDKVEKDKIDSLATVKDKPEVKEITIKKKEPVRIKNQGFLYAGIMAGADVTTVKFQSVKNAGYSAGLLLGYQFNRSLSIESGVYYERKFYYSDGKYFKSHYNTSSRKFIEVTGDCKMLEVPVNIKYNFINNRKTAWFITSGVSAYFMKGEKYDYTYTSWGQEYYASYNNKNAADFLFSALNLSVGYTQQIGKSSTLRLEPYFKIPLKGIGSGKLPITSSGVYLGLTKKIW